jgi:hypothetical protein
MDQQQTINILLCIQTAIGSLVAIRAFYLYARSRSEDLAIVGIAMITIAIASISGLVADNFFARSDTIFGSTINILWFQYGGQTMSYFFLFLSTLQGSGNYLNRLLRWHLLVTGLLIVLLLLTPVVPSFSGPIPQAVLSNSRGLVCFIIFLRYITLFFAKATRFSFLMALAFMLLAFGIVIITAQFFPHGPIIFIYVGYAMRISGLISLLLAFSLG